MKILITGGAGFIGSHLCEELLASGHQVQVIDNLSTGGVGNLESCLNHHNFSLIVDTVLNAKLVEDCIQQADLVYHLAAAVGVKLIVTAPIDTIETNIYGTANVLHACNRWRKPLVFTSTSEIYGKNTADTFSEDDDMLFGPTSHSRWSYACSKAIDEFLVKAYFKRNHLPVIIVRLFNTVGPRQTSQYGMVIPSFTRQALKGEPITIYGNGQQRRTFCYVSDVVNALIDLPKHPQALGQVFNIGGCEEISIAELAGLIKTRAESNSDLIYIPYDQAYEPGFEDMTRRVPNISKIQSLIGYRPTVSLEHIISRVIAHFRSHPEFF